MNHYLRELEELMAKLPEKRQEAIQRSPKTNSDHGTMLNYDFLMPYSTFPKRPDKTWQNEKNAC